MELKLNIYNHGKVAKTYTVNDFTLTTGLCEDVLKLIDFEKFVGAKLTQEQMGFEVFKIVAHSFDKIRPFFLDMFEGMTEEEFRKTSAKELAQVVIGIVNYSINELNGITGSNEKN